MKINLWLRGQAKKLASPNFLIVALAALLVITLISFIDQFKLLEKTGLITPPAMDHNHLRHIKRPANPTDIRGWMTFNYINKVFNLPPQLLSQQLHMNKAITYPAISIQNYALRTHQNQTEVITQIQTIIRNYVTSNL